jgi:DnaK suppressor protein
MNKAKSATKKTQSVQDRLAKVKLAANYTPGEKEEYMNDTMLKYFLQRLLAWKAELIEKSQQTIEHLREENWHEPDIADRASLETEAGVELRTRNRYLKLISEIDAAVARIFDATYGYCVDTGDEIGVPRMLNRPTAKRTVVAQERHERMEKQYSDDDETEE